jgi:hypothetical protein
VPEEQGQAHGTRRHRRILSSLRIRAIVPEPSPEKRRREMATASAGRAARGCREAPARSARPCGATASRFAGRAGGSQAQGQTTRPCARTRGSRHDKPPFRNRRTENRRRTYRSIPRRAAPPLLSRHRVRARQLQNPNRSRHAQGDRHDPPSPSASPTNGRLKPRFNIKLRPAKPFEPSRPERACQSPTSSGAIAGR